MDIESWNVSFAVPTSSRSAKKFHGKRNGYDLGWHEADGWFRSLGQTNPSRIAKSCIRALLGNDSTLRSPPLTSDDTEDADDSGALNGSVDDMARFLRELAELAGQPIDPPALELQFGPIRTLTRIAAKTGQPGIEICCLFPPCDPTSSVRQHVQSLPCEFAWQPHHGCYALTFVKPVAALPSERSVLDAILDAADQATALLQAAGPEGAG